MKYWEEEEDVVVEITESGEKWVDAAIHDGWSPREAEELGREWDRLEEKDRYK